MKTIFKLTTVAILTCNAAFAQDIAAKAGPNSIFVWCGHEVPKHFSYYVSRKTERETEWSPVAVLKFPASSDAFQGRLMNAYVYSNDGYTFDEPRTKQLWEKLRKVATTDSLLALAGRPSVLVACGNALWDASAKPNVSYQYRIQKKDHLGKVLFEKISSPVKYPGKAAFFEIDGMSTSLAGNSISMNFIIRNGENLGTCKVFRSYYAKNKFSEIKLPVSYFLQGDEIVAEVVDETALEKVPYSYFLLPYDTWGNKGYTSDTIHVYNTDTKDISAAIQKFRSVSLLGQNAIQLSWKLETSADIVSVDIYKGIHYDQYYTRVASVSPLDSVYIDYAVKPVTSYFYTLVLNTAYGRSFPSGRISGMLPANQKNIFPPMNVKVERTQEMVRLSWKRVDKDTRGYYVYRSNGFNSPMHQVSDIILSGDSIVHFSENINSLPPSSVWVYSVAGVNTSYAISPLSEKVSVKGKSLYVPVPRELAAIPDGDQINLLWNTLSSDYPNVSGYWIFRRAESEDGKPVEKRKKITSTPLYGEATSFTDTTAREGLRYFYAVQAVGLDTSEVSAISNEIGCIMYQRFPLPPANVRVFNYNEGIVLQWDLPIDPTISEIKIYRTLPKGSWKVIKELDKNSSEYIDRTVTGNTTYLYRIDTVNKAGRSTPMESPVGIHTN